MALPVYAGGVVRHRHYLHEEVEMEGRIMVFNDDQDILQTIPTPTGDEEKGLW
jgi:hypothetical protein